MQRWCSKLRSLALLRASSSPSPKSQPLVHHHRRLFHSNDLTKTLIISRPPLLPSTSATSILPSSVPALMQVRYLTLKQRKRKLKCRQPPTPVVSKLKKIKMKSYSSFKGRFRTMKDGQIRRWKEGKRHNAHQKSKIAKRRGRLPAVVPVAYAKVMKKLNFCG
ncbi:putative ribosomal protein L35 [Helianthus debilis subsp. tardiflorus]